MSEARYKQAQKQVAKLEKDEWMQLRAEMDLRFGVQDAISTDLLKQYEAPVQQALSHVNLIIGVIVGVALAGTKHVAKHQIETLGRVLIGGLSDVNFRIQDAWAHGVPFHLETPADYAPQLYSALVAAYVNYAGNGQELRAVLAENDPLWKTLSDNQQSFGPGQKAVWKDALAKHWLQVEQVARDKSPAAIRRIILEEFANPVLHRTVGTGAIVDTDEWTLKPEHEDKRRWFDSLMIYKARKKPYAYRNWLINS